MLLALSGQVLLLQTALSRLATHPAVRLWNLSPLAVLKLRIGKSELEEWELARVGQPFSTMIQLQLTP